MKVQHILENDWTGQQHTVIVDDMVSPNGGYSQKYADRVGIEYAKYRAPEQLEDDSYTCINSNYIK